MGSVLIESRLVGKLIGPRGATIQQLQSEYNVHISISKEDDQDGNRTAEIRGNDEDVQSAIAAIQERFCQPGGGSGGGGGGYRGNNDRQGGYQQRTYNNSGGAGGYSQGGGYQGGYQQRQNRDEGGQWGGRGGRGGDQGQGQQGW